MDSVYGFYGFSVWILWIYTDMDLIRAYFQRRLFYAPVSSEDNVVIENFKDITTTTNNHSNTNIKNCQSHLE
jgi:hypothetical protein